MSLRDQLLPQFQTNWRRIMQNLGFRTNAVTILVRTWPSGLGVGTPTTTSSLAIDPVPRIREVNGREISDSGGKYAVGDLRIGPITPRYENPAPGGGYTPEQIAPTPTNPNVEVIYRVTGPSGGDYRRLDFEGHGALGYSLVVSKLMGR